MCVVQPQSDPVQSVRAKSSHGTKRPPVWPCLSVCVSGGVSLACLHPAAGRTMHVELVVRTLHRRMPAPFSQSGCGCCVEGSGGACHSFLFECGAHPGALLRSCYRHCRVASSSDHMSVCGTQQQLQGLCTGSATPLAFVCFGV